MPNACSTSVCALLLASAGPLTAGAELPVIPGAEGFGITTPAGRGSTDEPAQIFIVTHTGDSGDGSLRACIEASGPRVCAFETSGVIEHDDWAIGDPYLTIAGQTAPSPGIALRGQQLEIRTHDVLIQHVRFRGTEDGGGRDVVQIQYSDQGTYNIILDHVTVSWGSDENIATWADNGQDGAFTRDITFRSSISSEALLGHSMGFLAARDGNDNIAVVGSLFAHNNDRNPKLGDGRFVVANNVVYNWGSRTTRLGGTVADGSNPLFDGIIVGNVNIPGPDHPERDSAEQYPHVDTQADGTNRLFMADNRWGQDLVEPPYERLAVTDGDLDTLDTMPAWNPIANTLASDDVLDHVLACAGARPTDRDEVDARIVADVRAGTGRLVESPSATYELAENTRPLDLPDDPQGDDDGDGYTNLEEWLHEQAYAIQCPEQQGPNDPGCGEPGGPECPGGTTGTSTDGGASSGSVATGNGAGSTGGSNPGSGAMEATAGSAATDDPEAAGCGCATGRRDSAGLLASLLGLLGLGVRRRRSLP